MQLQFPTITFALLALASGHHNGVFAVSIMEKEESEPIAIATLDATVDATVDVDATLDASGGLGNDIVCPAVYDPVWCEGKKYSNLCEAGIDGYIENQCNDNDGGDAPVVVDDCLRLMAPIWKETIGNVDEYPYVDETVQILSQDDVTVTFSVNQLLMEGGTPMMAVNYREATKENDEVCDMNAAPRSAIDTLLTAADGDDVEEVEQALPDGEIAIVFGGRRTLKESASIGLIEYGAAQEYTAQCTYGYADIAVYAYVGPKEDFDVEECEACTAPNEKYIGYYISVPCVPLCLPTIPPTATITVGPTFAPTNELTFEPTLATDEPTNDPTSAPTNEPTEAPTDKPTDAPVVPITEPPIVLNGADDDTNDDTFISVDDDCLKLMAPIWKETIGNVDEYPYVDETVQILSQDDVTVTFSVNQLLMEAGTPMIAVNYRESTKGNDEVCDMNAHTGGIQLIEYGSAQEYTAQCTYGYADIGVYAYVGPKEEFDVEECEACAAPNENYIGYYISVPCVPLCLPTIPPATITSAPTNALTFEPTLATDEPTNDPTFAPTDEPTNEPTFAPTNEPTEAPTDKPTDAPVVPLTEPPIVTNGADDDDDTLFLPSCPEDVTLVTTVGETDWPSAAGGGTNKPVVEIVSQDTSTVTVSLNQEWTSEQQSVDSIFYSYKPSVWSQKCYEEQRVVGQSSFADTITIQCNVLTPYAFLQICVADDASNGILSATGLDNATIPKCCQSEEETDDTPTVCYTVEIRCDSLCIDEATEESRRMLRLRGSSSSK